MCPYSCVSRNLGTVIGEIFFEALTFQRKEDTSGTTLYFKVVNESGAEVTKEDYYKLDMTNPSCLSNKSSVISVAINPGAIALQVIPFAAYSFASDLVNPTIPALEAA